MLEMMDCGIVWLNMKRNRVLLLLLLGISVLVLGNYCKRNKLSLEVFNVNVQSDAGMKDEVIVAMFIQDIEDMVQDYYTQGFSKDVAIYNYEIAILGIQKPGGGIIQIKFGITPMVGAHNPIGYDEITYTINSRGEKQFVDYEHIK